MTLFNKYNSWISTEEIETLNYEYPYSRWTDLYPCKGKWEIEIVKNDISEETINIHMPMGDWGGPHKNYFKIYSGRYEVIENKGFKGNESELLIWTNEKSPISFNFNEGNNSINLTILSKLITFQPKK